MKRTLIYLILIVSPWLVSCVYTEGEMPAQDFTVAFEKDIKGFSFSSRVYASNIDTLILPGGQLAYDVHLPPVRWGQGIFLGWVYRGKNPETDNSLFYVSKEGVEAYSISIAEIRSLRHTMVDLKEVFILPINNPQMNN